MRRYAVARFNRKRPQSVSAQSELSTKTLEIRYLLSVATCLDNRALRELPNPPFGLRGLGEPQRLARAFLSGYVSP